MDWQLTIQALLFILAIPLFGLLGYRRGWGRETFSLGGIILAIIFLAMNGGVALAKLGYQFLFEKSLTDHELMTSHLRFVQISSVIGVAVIVGLGYMIGRRAFPKPTSSLGGFILGVITGAVVAAYLTNYLFPGIATNVISSGSINLQNVVPSFIGNSTLALIFLIAVVAVIIGLILARPKKGGGGEAKK